MKSHIGPQGPGRCSAEPDNCPFSPMEDHFSSLKEAKEVYMKRLESNQETVAILKSQKKKITQREQELLDRNAELAKKIIEMRAASGEITYEDANPERAKRRLEEAVNYARTRQNEYLRNKLIRARVLPSGSFQMADGTRVNMDDLHKEYVIEKQVNATREAFLKKVEEMTTKEGELPEKVTLKTPTATYSLTFKEGFNESEFDKLPEKTKNMIMKESTSFSVDAAREELPPSVFRKIVQDVQSFDVISGKKPDVNIPELKYRGTGSNVNEKAEDALTDYAVFHNSLIKEHGSFSEMKKHYSAGTNAIKTIAASNQDTVFVPARSQFNGGLVSRKQILNQNKVHELLTPEERERITRTTMKPDPEKAAGVLSPEQYKKIFKAHKASLRVTEAKPKK